MFRNMKTCRVIIHNHIVKHVVFLIVQSRYVHICDVEPRKEGCLPCFFFMVQDEVNGVCEQAPGHQQVVLIRHFSLCDLGLFPLPSSYCCRASIQQQCCSTAWRIASTCPRTSSNRDMNLSLPHGLNKNISMLTQLRTVQVRHNK